MSGKHINQARESTLPSLKQLNSLYPDELLEPNKGINLRDFWQTIIRHKKLLLSFIILAFLTSLIASLLMKPVYRASATIQIEREPSRASEIVSEHTSRRKERDFWQTQIELIRSRRLASNVIKKLKIESKFNSSSGLFSFLSNNVPRPIESKFLEGLTVEPLNNSSLFLLSYESSDPKLAAKIVNTLAESYIEMNFKKHFEAMNTAKNQYEKEIARQTIDLLASQKQLQNYAIQHNIIELDGSQTTQSHRAKKLTEELVRTERQRITLESELQQFEAISKSKDPSLLLKDPNIQNLKAELTKLEKKNKLDTKRFGSRSRRVKRQLGEIETLRGKIRAEASLLKETLKTRYETARHSEEILRKRLKVVEEASLKAQSEIQPYHNFKRSVENKQALVKSLQENLGQLVLLSSFDSGNVSIIDRANVPYKKFKPNIKMNVIFGLLTGLLLGIAAIFLRDFMDDSIKSIDELERITKLPLLGAIPYLKRSKKEDIALQIVKEPKSKISEAIRSLKTTLSLSTQDGTPKLTFITSSSAAEGKSTSAVNLASSYATTGNTVVIIDADLRSPSLHTLLRLDPRQGLSNYLTDNCDISNIIQVTSIPGLYAIAAGSLPPDPVELLSGARMKDLISKVSKQYDYVIIDGPPVLGLADALILANLADATILTVHAGETHKGQILTSIKRLKRAKAHLIGTLLNQASSHGNAYSYNYLHYSYGAKAKEKQGIFQRLFG